MDSIMSLSKLDSMGDSRVHDLFLMQSHLNPILLTAAYVLFIYVIGPKLMKNQKPLSLKTVILFYNVFQIIYNVYLSFLGFQVFSTFAIWCSPPISKTHPLQALIVHIQHAYVLLKATDFIETIFFVLRKKNHQASFLHVFHHVGIFLHTWYSCKHYPGGIVIMALLLNCNVHIVMYLYYLVSSFKNLSNTLIKPFITSIQIGHQLIIFVLLCFNILNPSCTYPKLHLISLTSYVAIVLNMFRNFYKQSYTAKKEQRYASQKKQ